MKGRLTRSIDTTRFVYCLGLQHVLRCVNVLQRWRADKVIRSDPRVPGDLRFSLVFICVLKVSFDFLSFSTLAILVSYWFPSFRAPGDLMARPYGKTSTVHPGPQKYDLCYLIGLFGFFLMFPL